MKKSNGFSFAAAAFLLLVIMFSHTLADSFNLSDDNAWRVEMGGSEYITVSGVYNAPTDNRTNLTIGGNVKHNGMTFKVGEVGRYPNIETYWFSSMPKLTTVTVNSPVLRIGNAAFMGSKTLTTITMADTVTAIGGQAFQGCTKLKNVTVGSKLKTVAYSAFNGVTSLTGISLPNTVSHIGEYAFRKTGLTSFTVPTGVTVLKRGTFKECSSLTSIYIPTGVTAIEDDCFLNSPNVNVVYAGSKSQWAAISIGANNNFKSITYSVNDNNGGSSSSGTTPKPDVCHCSTEYAGKYVVKGTNGSLAINSGHGYGASSGFIQLGTIPEGTTITITKASGYYGRGKSSGHWGHVTYNGISGYCAMNYLEKADTQSAVNPSVNCTTCSTSYAGYYTVRGTSGCLAINNGHGYGNGYTQLGTIPEGTTIYISKATGYSGRGKSSGQWGHVTYNGVTGCCAMNYLDVTDSSDTCSSSYAGYYRVKGTAGALAINNGHGYGGSYTQLGTIPEGTVIYISKAMNYLGHGKSQGYWGHVTYNGVSGLCAMNYLEFVSKDVTAPVINNNLYYDNMSVSGFDVHATVTDDVGVVKVVCAVWTQYNGQDDLPSDWNTRSVASLNGSSAVYHVSFSDHNNEKGIYIIDFYAYDQAGNYDTERITVNADNNAPAISRVQIPSKNSRGFDLSVTATDSGSGVSEIRISTWNDIGGQNAAVLDGMIFEAAASKTASFHISAPENQLNTTYHTSVTAIDALGNTSTVLTIATYIDAISPGTPTLKISSVTETGFKVTVTASDDHALDHILLYAWTPDNDQQGNGQDGMDQVAEYIGAISSASGSYTFNVSIADLGNEIDTRYKVYAVAVDSCGNRSVTASSTATTKVSVTGSKLTLPSSLRTVGSEAFTGTIANYVVLPSGCTSIGAKAFANCSQMSYIFIPASVTSIADSAFTGCSGNLTILAPIGSYAQSWAEGHSISWIHKDK